MREKITFDCRGLTLEGLLAPLDSFKAAIITHPHPLYGGDMNNPVVEAVAKAYGQKGWSTLRFNFRGTGASDGRYDNGTGERSDIDAAIAYLQTKGFQQIDLAGYSFGAWVLAHWTQTNSNHRHGIRFVAPPVAFVDFAGIDAVEGLKQVIVGSRDDMAPPEQVGLLIRSWHPGAKLNIIQNADHFFRDHLAALQQMIGQHIV